MASCNAKLWLKAFNEKIDAMDQLEVWEIVPIELFFLISTLWVFFRKILANGVPNKLKARLCAQGNTQKEGGNYNETYAPTGGSSALRTALKVGVNKGMEIHQMDIENTFLKGALDKQI